MRNEIVHLTLNTGPSRITDLGEIDDVVSVSLGLLVHQTIFDVPNHAPWRCKVRHCVGGALFELMRDDVSAVVCTLAWDDTLAPNIWGGIEAFYFRLGDMGLIEGEYVHMPEQTPWLAVIQMPGLAAVTGQDLAWMGDFEKCMAQALLSEVEHGRIQ